MAIQRKVLGAFSGHEKELQVFLSEMERALCTEKWDTRIRHHGLGINGIVLHQKPKCEGTEGIHAVDVGT